MLLCWLGAVAVGHTDTSSTDRAPATARAAPLPGLLEEGAGQLSLTARICSGQAAQGEADHRWKWQQLFLVPFFPRTTAALLWPCRGEAALPRALSSMCCLTRIATESCKVGVRCCLLWGCWEGCSQSPAGKEEEDSAGYAQESGLQPVAQVLSAAGRLPRFCCSCDSKHGQKGAAFPQICSRVCPWRRCTSSIRGKGNTFFT